MESKPAKRTRPDPKDTESLPEVALAAITSYRKQKEVGDFINFMLEALERNSNWLYSAVGKQPHFKCVLMTGAGPNRFQIQEIVYPCDDEKDIKLDVELNDSVDHDKVALAAIIKISNADIEHLLKYMKTRMYDNPKLKEDMLKGKALGFEFAVLRPMADKQYRLMERIIVGNATKENDKKRKRDDHSLAETILRKTRRKV